MCFDIAYFTSSTTIGASVMTTQLITNPLTIKSKEFSLLSHEDEKRLFAEIAKGCDKAKEIVVLSNMGLVYKEVNKANLPTHTDDLCSEGIMGLLTAVKMFDPDKGYRFSTYATWWVMQSVHEYILKNRDIIRIPKDVEAKRRKIMAAKNLLEGQGETVTLEKIAGRTNLSTEQVKKVLSLDVTAVYEHQLFDEDQQDGNQEFNFDRMVSSDTDTTLSAAELEDMASFIEHHISMLSNVEQEIISSKYWKSELKTRPIAERMGKSKQYIDQVERNALRKMKRHMLQDGMTTDKISM